jgi:hypothetical protein
MGAPFKLKAPLLKSSVQFNLINGGGGGGGGGGGAAGARDIDAGGRGGLETGGCEGESAVSVVLPECTCGREMAAYHRSVVSSLGEHGCVAWTCHVAGGGRGDHAVVATGIPWQRGRRTGRGEAGAIMARWP